MQKITDNKEQQRFELHEGGHTAVAEYELKGEKLYINHVFAPEELRGTGAAGRLMAHIADTAKRDGLEIVPVCSYAAHWLKKHGTASGGKKPAP